MTRICEEKMKLGLLTGLTLLASSAVAQNQRPSSPRSSDVSSPLHEAVKEIQNKVNEQGEIRYVVISQNLVKGETVEKRYTVETHVVANAVACTLQISAHLTRDGQVQSHGRTTVQLREATTLAIKTETQLINERTARAGVRGWKGKVTPENYVLQVFRSGTLAGIFFFHDSQTADLVAMDMSRAIELCGGIRVMP
jgi:hypothetical protein